MTAPYLPRAPRQPTPQEVAQALGMVPMAGAPNLTPDGVSPYAGVKAGDSQGGTGWAARLFGGSDPLASGLLSAPDARGLGRDALRNFGIALLQNSGPAPYRRGLGEILGTSLAQGQHAYETGVQGTLAQRQLRQQQAEQQRIAQQRQELAGMILQNPDFANVIPRVIAQAAGGDQNATSLLGAMSNLRTDTGRPALAFRVGVDPSTGKRATAVIDERNPVDAQGRIAPLGYLPLPEDANGDTGLPGYLTPEGIDAAEERARRLASIQGRGSAGTLSRRDGLDELVALAHDIVDPEGLLDQHPTGVGASRLLPDLFNVRLDPEGIPLRSTISNLKTTIRQLRSGAAVTESEARQLEGMLPDRADTPDGVRKKLNTLLIHLNRMARRVRGESGTPPTPATSSYAPPP